MRSSSLSAGQARYHEGAGWQGWPSVTEPQADLADYFRVDTAPSRSVGSGVCFRSAVIAVAAIGCWWHGWRFRRCRPGLCWRGQSRILAVPLAGLVLVGLDQVAQKLFHIRVDDIDTAMGWIRSDTFKEASKLAKVTGRGFYLAQPQT